MPINVFVSHAYDDAALCSPLLAALESWGVSYWFDSSEEHAGGQLSAAAQVALGSCNVLLRICTPGTRRSYWMSLEAGAFLSFLADDHRKQIKGQRRLVNLILQAGYQREPFDVGATLVDASDPQQTDWVNDLRRALELPPLEQAAEVADIAAKIHVVSPRGLSRRAALSLAAGGIVALGLATTGGLVAVRNANRGGLPPPSPTATATATATAPTRDERLRWWLTTNKSGAVGTAASAISASPVLDGATLYVGTEDGTLYALDRSTGKPLWTFSPGANRGQIYWAPVVMKGIAYVLEAHDAVYAVRNGAKLWSTAADSSTSFSVLAIAGGTLYVSEATFDAFVDALDPATGAHGIGLTPTTGASPSSGPTFAAGHMYIAATDGYLYAFDRAHLARHEVWRAETGAAEAVKQNQPDSVYVASLPVVADGVVYAGSLDNNLYALDAQTGVKRWVFTTGGEIDHASAAVADGLVYIGSGDHKLYAVDATTGKKRWSYTTGAAIQASPTVADGVVYVGSQDANVYALDAHTGGLVRTFQTAAPVIVQPIVSQGLLYAADLAGYIYSFAL